MASFCSLTNQTLAFALTVDEFRQKFPPSSRPSYLKVTTMTITSKIGIRAGGRLDVDRIKRFFENGAIHRFKRVDREGNAKPFEWNEQKPKHNKIAFFNQVSLEHFNGYSLKAIKIFPNGSVQIAGCADLLDAKRTITQLGTLLREIYGAIVDVRPENFDVQLINSNFSLNRHLDLRAVMHHFQCYPEIFDVTFDPDRYSACKIKWKPYLDTPKAVTASVFSTGRVIITGATNLKQLCHAYHQIADMLVGGHRSDLVTETTKPKEIELFDQYMGYKMSDLVPWLRARGFRSWVGTSEERKIKF